MIIDLILDVIDSYEADSEIYHDHLLGIFKMLDPIEYKGFERLLNKAKKENKIIKINHAELPEFWDSIQLKNIYIE